MTLPTPPPLSQPIPTPKISASRVSGDANPSSIVAGVSGLESGVGILLSSNVGEVKITNTGVTSLVAGPGVSLDGSTGRVTISAHGKGTVTTIYAGKGLQGGKIEEVGTISLAPSGVIAGNYSAANIVVDAFGRVLSATNGQPKGASGRVTFGGRTLVIEDGIITEII